MTFACVDLALWSRAPRSELFLELPDRKDYDDYYEMIEEPISLDIVRETLDAKKCDAAVQCPATCSLSSILDTRNVGTQIHPAVG